jgi:hypothetical protein
MRRKVGVGKPLSMTAHCYGVVQAAGSTRVPSGQRTMGCSTLENPTAGRHGNRLISGDHDRIQVTLRDWWSACSGWTSSMLRNAPDNAGFQATINGKRNRSAPPATNLDTPLAAAALPVQRAIVVST